MEIQKKFQIILQGTGKIGRFLEMFKVRERGLNFQKFVSIVFGYGGGVRSMVLGQGVGFCKLWQFLEGVDRCGLVVGVVVFSGVSQGTGFFIFERDLGSLLYLLYFLMLYNIRKFCKENGRGNKYCESMLLNCCIMEY